MLRYAKKLEWSLVLLDKAVM